MDQQYKLGKHIVQKDNFKYRPLFSVHAFTPLLGFKTTGFSGVHEPDTVSANYFFPIQRETDQWEYTVSLSMGENMKAYASHPRWRLQQVVQQIENVIWATRGVSRFKSLAPCV